MISILWPSTPPLRVELLDRELDGHGLVLAVALEDPHLGAEVADLDDLGRLRGAGEPRRRAPPQRGRARERLLPHESLLADGGRIASITPVTMLCDPARARRAMRSAPRRRRPPSSTEFLCLVEGEADARRGLGGALGDGEVDQVVVAPDGLEESPARRGPRGGGRAPVADLALRLQGEVAGERGEEHHQPPLGRRAVAGPRAARGRRRARRGAGRLGPHSRRKGPRPKSCWPRRTSGRLHRELELLEVRGHLVVARGPGPDVVGGGRAGAARAQERATAAGDGSRARRPRARATPPTRSHSGDDRGAPEGDPDQPLRDPLAPLDPVERDEGAPHEIARRDSPRRPRSRAPRWRAGARRRRPAWPPSWWWR